MHHSCLCKGLSKFKFQFPSSNPAIAGLEYDQLPLPQWPFTQQVLHKVVPPLFPEIFTNITPIAVLLTGENEHVKFFIGLNQRTGQAEGGAGVDVFVYPAMSNK